jgi:hypothetical protein
MLGSRMKSLEERIAVCENLRRQTSEAMAKVLKDRPTLSEVEFRDYLAKELFTGETVHKEGWYNPPPLGITALFCDEGDTKRTYFTSLRHEEYWARDDRRFDNNSVGLVYASPVDKKTGMIGDIALSVCRGSNDVVSNHLQQSLSIVETIAEYAKVGMSLSELVDYAQEVLEKSGLSQTSFVSTENKLIKNIGHTIPWSYELPTAEEQSVIEGDDFEKLKNLISKKRIFLDADQEFKIPETICFTVEMNISNPNNSELPSAYYHLLVVFKGGKKEIIANFDPILQATGMNASITSKYH